MFFGTSPMYMPLPEARGDTQLVHAPSAARVHQELNSTVGQTTAR